MKISIIHPSHGRPEQALQTFKKWINNIYDNTNVVEYILSIDYSDEKLSTYLDEFHFTAACVNHNRSAIDAINNAAKIATGDIFIVVSDDFDCPLHWDKLLLDAIGSHTDFVAKTNDTTEDWIITLPIMDRVYYNRFGYIYYPEYKHLFCDTEMTHVAELLGRKLVFDITFKHNHPAKHGDIDYPNAVAPDALTVRNNATWDSGEALYLSRVKNNFGLKEVLPISLPHSHNSWLKSKNIFL